MEKKTRKLRKMRQPTKEFIPVDEVVISDTEDGIPESSLTVDDEDYNLALRMSMEDEM